MLLIMVLANKRIQLLDPLQNLPNGGLLFNTIERLVLSQYSLSKLGLSENKASFHLD